MNINWKDKESVFNAFSDICEVIDSTNDYREGYKASQQFDVLVKEYADNIPDEIAFDTDFLIRLIKRSGRLYSLVPEERSFDKELLLAWLTTGWWKTYDRQSGTITSSLVNARYYSRFIPKETFNEAFNDEEFAFAALKIYPNVYQYLPDILKRNEEILNEALNLDWENIRYIPKDVHINRDIAVAAVRRDGCKICYLPHEYDNDLEILYIAVRENPYSFSGASDIFRKDADLTIKMVKEENVPLDKVDDSLWKNLHFALEMFKLFGIKVLSNVEWFYSNNDEQYSFVKEIVKINPSSYAYLPESIKEIDELFKGGELKKIKEEAEAESLILKSKKTEQEKELDRRWDNFLNSLFVLKSMDLEEFQILFYDTYWYFKNREDAYVLNVGGWHILSCLSAFRKMPLDFCPSGCLLNEFNAARCICEDLLLEINKGMPGYYRESELVILRSCVPPAGCSNLSAEMNDYESFLYAFEGIIEDFDSFFEDWRSNNYCGRYNMP